jgi:hypothetical protein
MAGRRVGGQAICALTVGRAHSWLPCTDAICLDVLDRLGTVTAGRIHPSRLTRDCAVGRAAGTMRLGEQACAVRDVAVNEFRAGFATSSTSGHHQLVVIVDDSPEL